MSGHAPNFRIAMRKEGHWVNAYFAKMDTMEGAVRIGSLDAKFAAVVFDDFVALMQKALYAAGVEFSERRAAPEHERAGEG